MGRPKNIGVHSTGYSLPQGTFSTVNTTMFLKKHLEQFSMVQNHEEVWNYSGENRHRWFEADSRSLINYVVDRRKIWYTFLHTCFVCRDREAVRAH